MAENLDVPLAEIELTMRKFCAMQRIPAHNIKMSAERFFDTDDMVLRLDRLVWARALAKETLQFPKDWREAVKERFAPQWVKRRWPVQYAFVDMEVYHTYPELEIHSKKPVLQFTSFTRLPPLPSESCDG